ncbi:LptA/OstA family protein [Aquabacter spiritensis]|uniref:Lipopolysaccharide export system protein LptA n=1 Tax=Aquabacter spiritensis TaxID=933073 RepID=A0A4V2UXT4_9HYPH|nr:LptA/OstA family protein [Aquabacter spiritensis]TCT04738.1 lipopolysaccharide export system protein LptA [Aquabacter spiritensis]
MSPRLPVLAALLLASLAGPALAQQPPGSVPNALQGFARNRDQPVRITSNSLEVRDKDKTAVFAGNVVVVQGDTTMRSPELLVFYEGSAAPSDTAPQSTSSIRRLEAKGGVVVQTKEQTATGDVGIFEMKTNTVTMTGRPVVLTQGPNVIRGQKLTVDLVTGVSKIEGGRVESLIVPGSVKPNEAAPRR